MPGIRASPPNRRTVSQKTYWKLLLHECRSPQSKRAQPVSRSRPRGPRVRAMAVPARGQGEHGGGCRTADSGRVYDSLKEVVKKTQGWDQQASRDQQKSSNYERHHKNNGITFGWQVTGRHGIQQESLESAGSRGQEWLQYTCLPPPREAPNPHCRIQLAPARAFRHRHLSYHRTCPCKRLKESTFYTHGSGNPVK